MDSIVVKTEVQNNGEILLYYVDENGESQEGVLATVENIENDSIPLQSSYMLENYDELVDDPPSLEQEDSTDPNFWTDDETKRILIFYNDNKATFISGRAQKKHLWSVACKTMLIGKDQASCEAKLEELKTKYFDVRSYIDKGVIVKWPFLEMCHQAFHDTLPPETVNKIPRVTAKTIPTVTAKNTQRIEMPQPVTTEIPHANITVTSEKQLITDKAGFFTKKQVHIKSPDEQTKQLLETYLKYKQSFRSDYWRRDLWDKIAEEMGEQDSEYLQKKFLNHKQHYINMYLKRKSEGPGSITWPYMSIFDNIYKDDVQFHKKHFNEDINQKVNVVDQKIPEHEWSMVQMMILTKYYFDCYHEFEDNTIPKKFLWTEVGRLVEKKPETCEIKYQKLRKDHLDKVVAGVYNLQQRIPLCILFDNIIAKDVQKILSKESASIENDIWDGEQLDELVQFFYTNIEIFKDSICHFVCWAAISHKLKRSIQSCKVQWDMLVDLYKHILEEKKEDPDLQIDWRYIELFDRIFDYGMDEELLKGYDIEIPEEKPASQVIVKKVDIKTANMDTGNLLVERPIQTEKENKNLQPRTDPRSARILEHYLRNKDKFEHTRNKTALWDPLAKQIGLSPMECAHRFKTLKQTYIDYIQKEIDQPRVPVTWPYFNLCKKVFGYRIIKNKLKQGEIESNKADDWLAREIKAIISYFAKHFHEINSNVEDVSKWAELASEIGKTEASCKEKFVELRKCYRKLKTMRSRNPDVKISWSYFQMFDRIYSAKDEEAMEVDNLEEEHLEMDGEVADEDYQCIIVLQDGQVILQNPEDVNNPEIIQQLQMSNLSEIIENTNVKTEIVTTPSKWTKRSKKRLLIYYMNYIRSSRGEKISPKHMWTSIASKFQSKKPVDCKKMFLKMKRAYEQADDELKNKSPYTFLLEKVLKLKPKFSIDAQDKQFKNVEMASDKVNLALVYYLEHIEDFVNPQFEKKYLWTQLANYISEPVSKVYNKINYLKQAFNIETEDIDGEKTEFASLLKEIIAKEVAVKTLLEVSPSPTFSENENWTDDEIEILLTWYLGNLDKFKNPKFNRSYLWRDVSTLLNKSPLTCSKKMSEVRSQYRKLVKENVENVDWRFFALCQEIYGTGKREL